MNSEQTVLEAAWDALRDAATGRERTAAYVVVYRACAEIAAATARKMRLSSDDAEESVQRVALRVPFDEHALDAGRLGGVALDAKIRGWLRTIFRRELLALADEARRQRSIADEEKRQRSLENPHMESLDGHIGGQSAGELRVAFDALVRACAEHRYPKRYEDARKAFRETMLGCYDRATGVTTIERQIGERAGGAPAHSESWRRAREALYRAERLATVALVDFVGQADGGVTSFVAPPSPLESWDAVVKIVGRGVEIAMRDVRSKAPSTSDASGEEP